MLGITINCPSGYCSLCNHWWYPKYQWELVPILWLKSSVPSLSESSKECSWFQLYMCCLRRLIYQHGLTFFLFLAYQWWKMTFEGWLARRWLSAKFFASKKCSFTQFSGMLLVCHRKTERTQKLKVLFRAFSFYWKNTGGSVPITFKHLT